jgi:hypothetical protein
VQWQETLNHWLERGVFKDHSEFVFGMVLELFVVFAI